MFSAFKTFIEDLDIDKIQDQRDNFYGYDKSILSKQIKSMNATDIEFDDAGRYEIICSDSTAFDCLYFPSEKKKLYISISSGIAFGEQRLYPTFTRWSYSNIFDGIYICIEDPMYKRYPRGGVMWFFNKKNESYVYKLRDIIEKIMTHFNISPSNLYFLGSSMGGAISIMLGNLFSYSNVISMNAQYHPASFSPPSKKFFMEEFDIDISDTTVNNFDFIPRNITTSYFIITNASSPKDLPQLKYLSNKISAPMKYGLHQYGNIALWNHLSGTEHSVFPEKLLFLLVLYYCEMKKKGENLNNFLNINLLFSEILYQKYKYVDSIEYYKKQQTATQLNITKIKKQLRNKNRLLQTANFRTKMLLKKMRRQRFRQQYLALC